METQKDFKINRYFFLAIILLFAVFLLYSLSQFLIAFLAAIIFYVLSKSFAEWLIKKCHWKKSTTALIIILLSFLIIMLPLSVLGPLLFNKISQITSNQAEIIDGVKNFDKLLEQKFNIHILSDSTINSLPGYATTFVSAILSEGLNFFSTIIMMYFFLYFMIQKMGRMEAAIVFYLPFRRDKINMFGKELVSQTFSNAVGIPLIATAQGLCAYIAYNISGVNDPGFWGVVTGFTSILPIVGAGIVWLPITIFLFIGGHNWQAVFLLIWSVVIVGTIDNVIRFALAKRMADVHPIVTVLGVILGMKYFGFIGLIFGPLLISWFIILLKIYYTEYHSGRNVKTKTRHIVPKYMHPILGIKTENKNKNK